MLETFLYCVMESSSVARNRCLEENIRYAEEYNDKVKLIDISQLENLAEVNARVEDMQKQATTMLEAHFNKEKDELAAILDRQKALNDINSYVDSCGK